MLNRLQKLAGLNEMGTFDNYQQLVSDFPGPAKQSNPTDSPEHKWYLNVIQFIRNPSNPVEQRADLVKKFQNKFLSTDYGGEDQEDQDLIDWWLSDDEQDFIKGEMNSGEDVNQNRPFVADVVRGGEV